MKVTAFSLNSYARVALLLTNHEEYSQTLLTSPLVLYLQQSFHQELFSTVLSGLLQHGLNCSVHSMLPCTGIENHLRMA